MADTTSKRSPIGFAAKTELIEKAQRIATEVAGPAAADVDAKARFPREAFDALRKEKLLGAFIPKELGGGGASLSEITGICHTLGQSCASTAMIYAMHQIQIACMVRHRKDSAFFKNQLIDLAERELLVASATTEIGPSGNTRMSSCALVREGDHFTLEKNAPVISYGDHCDAILVTSRRAPDAPTSDQVLTLIRKEKGEYTLQKTSDWDTLGMRGTCSDGFVLKAKAPLENVLPTEFAVISAQTMLPFSHCVWTSLWLGIATDAVHRARTYIRGEARKNPGVTPPGALRLAETMNTLHSFRAGVQDGIREFENAIDDPEMCSSLGFAIRMNNMKIAASQLCVQTVGQALMVVGIMGYKANSKLSLTRHVRDSYGGALMISNDRIYGANSQLLCVYKDD